MSAITLKRYTFASLIVSFFTALVFARPVFVEDNAGQALRRAESLFNKKNFAQSQAVILESMKKWPDSYLKPEFLLLLSASYLNGRDADQAEIILNHLFDQNPRYKTDATARLIKANILQRHGKPDQAQMSLLELKSAEGFYHSALILEKSGQSFAAIGRFNQLITKFPDNELVIPAKIGLANSFYTLGDFDAAISHLEPVKSIQNNKDRAIRNYLLGSAYLKLGEMQKARGNLHQVALQSSTPLAPFAKTLIGLNALINKDYQSAKEILEENLTTKNKQCLVQSVTGLTEIYLRNRQSEKAIDVCQRALSQVKSKKLRSRLLMLRGLSFQHSGQVPLALEDFQSVLDLDQPEWSPRALTLMAHTLWLDGQYKRLVTDFRKSFFDYRDKFASEKKFDLDPKSSDEIHLSQLLIAEANFRLKRYKEAERIYGDILSGTPSAKRSAQAISGLISSLAYQKKFDQAETHLDKLMVRFGEDRDVLKFGLLTKAHFLWNRKNYVAAHEKYQRYTEMFSDSPKAAYAMYQNGRSLQKMNQPKDSLVVWENLRKKHPESPFAFRSLILSARAANDAGEKQKAQTYYNQIAKKGSATQMQKALLELGNSQYESQHYAEAIRSFDQLMKMNPNPTIMAQAKQKQKLSYQQLSRTNPKQLQQLTTDFSKEIHGGEGWFQIGLKNYEDRNYTKAIENFETVVQNHPHTLSASDAYFYKGEAEFRMGNYKKSLGTLRNFTQNYPEHRLFYLAELLRARALLRSGFVDEAILVFKNITEKVPDSAFASSAFLGWGAALEQKNEVDKQIRVYETFLTQFPGHMGVNRVHWKMGQLSRRKGKFGVALSHYKKVEPADGIVKPDELKKVISSVEEMERMKDIENKEAIKK